MDVELTPRLVKIISEKTPGDLSSNVVLMFNSQTGEMYFARGEDADHLRECGYGLRCRGKIRPYFKKGTNHYEGYTTPGRFCNPSQSACIPPPENVVVAKIKIVPDCDGDREREMLVDALNTIRNVQRIDSGESDE
jgi:hypothetical protein